MRAESRTAVLLTVFILCITAGLTPGGAAEGEAIRPTIPSLQTTAELGGLTPQNTLILSDEGDRDFCQDFSATLGNVTPQWRALTTDANPDGLPDQNIVLIGQVDSPYTGALIRELLTPDQIAALAGAEGYTIAVRDHPAHKNRTLVVASGADELLTKWAAEQALDRIMDANGPRGSWYGTTAGADRDAIIAHIGQFQHQPDRADLPIEALRIDVGARPPRRVTAAEAAEDVTRLFDLLYHGWCGYGYFSTLGDFDAARAELLAALEGRARWSPDDLSALLREKLDFVHDCHLNIHGTPYCNHLDFWSGPDLEVTRDAGGYTFISDGIEHRVTAINGQAPGDYLFPSLNAQGEPIYRIGLLARAEPEPLSVTAETAEGQAEFQVALAHADYLYGDRFGEDRIGGIPVLRARSFADYYSAELAQFIEAAATYRDEPYVIVDIRGNGGGSTSYPKGWITRFTGQTPSLKHVLTELTSRTSMMGRANLFAEMLASYPKEDAGWIQAEIDRYERSARQFDDPSAVPHWTALQIPFVRFIPNDTTLIVLADANVASAGEGLLSYLYRQVENVVVVGENTMGAVTFGQVSTHRLPHSRLHVTLPIKLNAMMDMTWREEQGYLPDLWVPAGEALNYAVAAVRNGTIGTQQEIPAGYFDANFRPERVRERNLITANEGPLTAVGLLALLGLLAVLLRRQSLFFLIYGIGAIGIGATLAATDNRIGFLLLPYGVMAVGIGITRWRRARKATQES